MYLKYQNPLERFIKICKKMGTQRFYFHSINNHNKAHSYKLFLKDSTQDPYKVLKPQ